MTQCVADTGESGSSDSQVSIGAPDLEAVRAKLRDVVDAVRAWLIEAERRDDREVDGVGAVAD